MDLFWQVILSNSILASALAAVALLALRFRLAPGIVHILLVLALLKLFTPPILSIRVPLPDLPAALATPHAGVPLPARSSELTAAESGEEASAGLPPMAVAPAAPSIAAIQSLLLALWIAGALGVAGWHARRIAVMRRLMRHALPAPDFLRQLASKYSARLGIARPPALLVLPVRITPAVWSLGGPPKIVFPADMVSEMDRGRLETLLVHELAHVRRRDHLVRLLELAATVVFWWHPLVWWARTQLREMEERACDALVLQAVPNSHRRYATALLELLEFLNVLPRPLPVVGTAVSPTVSLQRRISMMKIGSHRTATRYATLLAIALGVPAMAVALAGRPKPDEAPAASPPSSEAAAAEPAQGRVHVRNADEKEGQPRMVIRGDGQGSDGKQLFLDPDAAPGEPRMAFLGDGENADGKVRIMLRDPVDAELMMRLGLLFADLEMLGGRMILRDPENADGERRLILRDAENADGEPLLLRRRDAEGGEADGQRRIIRRDAGGERRLVRPGNAGDEEGQRKVIVPGEAAQE